MSFPRRFAFDARFWAFTILGTLTASMFGCFAYGISAQTTASEEQSVLSVNDALHQIELRQRVKGAAELQIAEKADFLANVTR